MVRAYEAMHISATGKRLERLASRSRATTGKAGSEFSGGSLIGRSQAFHTAFSYRHWPRLFPQVLPSNTDRAPETEIADPLGRSVAPRAGRRAAALFEDAPLPKYAATRSTHVAPGNATAATVTFTRAAQAE